MKYVWIGLMLIFLVWQIYEYYLFGDDMRVNIFTARYYEQTRN